ncbi:MAG: DUF72 domain-containing protein [Pyrinomonadaceae bacterium]
MAIKANIGTCGFGRGREAYVQRLSCVEVQHTFYHPPLLETLEQWRETVPEGFEFTIKAWQLITHATKSPTYRRLKRDLDPVEKVEAGYFQPTKIVHEAWEMTRACAKALRATAILFQCPASFKPTTANISNLKAFLAGIERDEIDLCWEPRGQWDTGVVREICNEFNIWHTVDPFEQKTVTPDRCYFRLHGRGGWRYKYDDVELTELAAMLPADQTSYVFFNNREMLNDAQRFAEILTELRA